MYFLSICFFYATVFVIGTEGISHIFQPAAPYFFNEFYGTDKVWVFLLLVPLIALIPDFLYIIARQNFFPNPSDEFIRDFVHVQAGSEDARVIDDASVVGRLKESEHL